eukprot:469781-Rhodomonas_salina.5
MASRPFRNTRNTLNGEGRFCWTTGVGHGDPRPGQFGSNFTGTGTRVPRFGKAGPGPREAKPMNFQGWGGGVTQRGSW